jgi:hypothetical protein
MTMTRFLDERSRRRRLFVLVAAAAAGCDSGPRWHRDVDVDGVFVGDS